MCSYLISVVAYSGVAVIDKRRKPKAANSHTTFPELIPHVYETIHFNIDLPTIVHNLFLEFL